MMNIQLKEASTEDLGYALTTALAVDVKKSKTCWDCGIKCRTSLACEFCISNELFTRRHTMEFMRLDLCIQAAVCLIAKSDSGTSGAQARGANKDGLLSRHVIIGDSHNDNN